LERFGARSSAARRAYREFVADGVAQVGGRSRLGGGPERPRAAGPHVAASAGRSARGDDRIFGDSAFVGTALAAAGECLERREDLRTRGRDFGCLLQRIAAAAGLPPRDLLTPSKNLTRVTQRSRLCYVAVRELRLPGAVVADRLGLSRLSVSRAVARTGQLAVPRGEDDGKRINS
jgi:hypothetical protein